MEKNREEEKRFEGKTVFLCVFLVDVEGRMIYVIYVCVFGGMVL